MSTDWCRSADIYNSTSPYRKAGGVTYPCKKLLTNLADARCVGNLNCLPLGAVEAEGRSDGRQWVSSSTCYIQTLILLAWDTRAVGFHRGMSKLWAAVMLTCY